MNQMWKAKPRGGTPCKWTKFSVNAATQTNDALEAKVDFCCDTHYNETPVVTTKDLGDIQVYQTITVRHMVLSGDNKAQPVPTKN